MPTHSLDAFVSALQAELARAQARVEARHRALVERRFAEAGPLETPLLSLRRWVMPRVTGFSLELDVALETERRRYRSGLLRVCLVVRESLGGERRRLRIILAGAQPGGGEVWLDDVALRRLESPVEPGAAARRTPVKGLFQRLLRWLRMFFRRLFRLRRGAIRLRLSEEDAKRLSGLLSLRSS